VPPEGVAWILVAAIGAVLAAPIARRVRARRFDPFEPLVLFCLAYGVMFVGRPAAMLLKGEVSYTGPRTTLDVSGTFTEMLAIALLGAAAFVLAYDLALRGRGPATAGRRLDSRRATALAIALGALGITSFAVFLFAADGIGTLEAIFRAGPQPGLRSEIEARRHLWEAFGVLVPAAMILVAVGVRERKRLAVAIGVALIVIFLLRSVPLGARISLLPLVGGLFVLYYLRRSSRPSPRTLVAVALLAVFASAFLSDLRGRTTRGESVPETVARAASPSRLADSVFLGPDSEMAATFAAALAVIPESFGHSYGKTIFRDLVVRPLPRPLWEGKPQPPRERLIARLWPSERINPEFSVLLYFYWDFGLIGVAIGLALAGLGCRALYRHLRQHEESTSAQVLYALCLWFVVIGLRNSPVDTLILAVFMVAPAWVVFRLAEVRA
jgi:hypothetical protein